MTLVGARQTGKTTLAGTIAASRQSVLFDLENPQHRAQLEDPLGALRPLAEKLVIVDEAQRVPEIFPVLRVLVDEARRPGRFLLLGSARPDLRRQSAESLAGRTLTVELCPLQLKEVQNISIDRLWVRGGLPPSLLASSSAFSLRWRRNYLRDVAERDLALQLGSRVEPGMMWRFLTMLAHLHGQLWNASSVARSLDVTYATAGRYLDLLEQLYLVRRLHPHFANIGKRLRKAPKVYLRDAGLLHALLDLPSMDRLRGHPVHGFSWEGLVMEQLLAVAPDGWEPAFWRTSGGAEIDLVMLHGGTPRVAVEMKTSLAPRPSRGFHQGCEDLGLRNRWVVYPGEERLRLPSGTEAISLPEALDRFLRIY